MNEISLTAKLTLNNGIQVPIFGLGTYQAGRSRKTREAVLEALRTGYRLIDTARMYGNEKEVGEALRQSDIPREEVFITTKLWNSDHGYESTLNACGKSLKELGLSYVDLYLIHWPVEDLRRETWRAMETLQREGKCRSIGVSNYTIGHLEELLGYSSTVPAVNQVEFHPYLYQKDLLEFCRSHDILLEAYAPLTKGRKLKDQKLIGIAEKYSKTPAQILIRWGLQKGTVVIPKSSTKERIRENAHVFDFSILPEDMEFLDSFHEELRTSWDPTGVR
ncbi:MAG: aldo/keto reductase [Candidatus Neomarinimicrobiota bacterium]